ncbi:MAG TPA: M50 family metallopeptidase [Sphingomicrobium sp.]|nr:M50 family metallopeptidase [Sphingomicrobium sp.]
MTTLPHPSLWLTLVAFVCALGPLVFFHELGHYLVARMFRIPAETFSIGFGREVFGWTDGQGTRWRVSWLPLGGYVKFVGDMTPASNPDDLENIPEELRDRAFQIRPVWQRFLVVLAGPAANFLLAILIFAAFFSFVGAPISNTVGQVQPNTPAARAGLRPGDRILSLAGRPTPTFADLANATAVRPGEMVVVRVQRGDLTRNLRLVLGSDSMKAPNGEQVRRGLLGVAPDITALKPIPIAQAIPEAISQTYRMTRANVDAILQMARGYISPRQIGGPIAIANVAGDVASMGPIEFIALLALLSINLGFINLLPVPMLDGGHLFFYIIEMVRRRPVSVATLDWAFRGGLALVLALLLFATGNDLGLWSKLERLIG